MQATDLIRDLFEADCDVFFTFNGTAANALALSASVSHTTAFWLTNGHMWKRTSAEHQSFSVKEAKYC